MSDFADLDHINLVGIQATGFHGVFDFERQQGQTFIVDVTLGIKHAKRIAESDDINDTVNYAEVAQVVHAHITGKPVNLIETLASRIAADLAVMKHVEAARVTVHKPQAPITQPDSSPLPFTDVSVTVTHWA